MGSSRFRRAAAALSGLIVASAAQGDPIERAFEDARGYTVYLDVSIEAPFIEDEQGTFEGTGMVIDRTRRWVLTNAHVVGHSPSEIAVELANGARAPARTIYIDPFLDLAVVRVDGETELATEARLDCDATPRIGLSVGAYGHPNGFKFMGSRGIVSGVNSQYGSQWLQTDAPINEGNSGGPLIRLDNGEVIGINAMRYIGKDIQNSNLAIAASHACRMVELLARDAEARPPDLGLLFFLRNDEPTLIVAQAQRAAAGAGIRRGDRIVALYGKPIEPSDEAQLMNALRGRTGEATLTLERAGTVSRDVQIVLTPREDPLARRGLLVDGALFAPSNHRDIDTLLDFPRLMVHFVAPGSVAERQGLQAYDHVVSVDGERVQTVDEVFARVAAQPERASASFELLRFVEAEDRFTEYVLARLPARRTSWISARP